MSEAIDRRLQDRLSPSQQADPEAVQQWCATAFYEAQRAYEKAMKELEEAKANAKQRAADLGEAQRSFVKAARIENPPGVTTPELTRANSYIIDNCLVSNYGGVARVVEHMRLLGATFKPSSAPTSGGSQSR